MAIFSDTQGQLTPHSVVKSGRNSGDFMAVLRSTCKNENDPIKTEGARMLTRLYIDFSDAQGQLTPQSTLESSRNSNSSTHVWLFLLPARMRKI